MRTRRLATFEVGAVGLGCMSLSQAYGIPPSPERAEAVLRAALDAGVTLFDTAATYGFGANERLLGNVLKSERARITLASKCGMQGVDANDDGRFERVIDGRPETLRITCDAALRRLQTDVIDVYYLHRWDKTVPIEDSVGALADLVWEGKVRAVGLCEVSAATLRKAHAVHPIAAVQSEYSLWTRNPEVGVLSTCREIGATLVPYSPVGRGFLAGSAPDPATFDARDIRRNHPRFTAEHHAANTKLLPAYRQIAHEAGCTPAQLALAWLLRKSPVIVPIPGTTSVEHLHENVAAADVELSDDTVARLEALIHPTTVSGDRYNARAASEVDTEVF